MFPLKCSLCKLINQFYVKLYTLIFMFFLSFLFICLFGWLSKYISVCLTVFLSVCLFPYLSITSLLWTVCPCLAIFFFLSLSFSCSFFFFSILSLSLFFSLTLFYLIFILFVSLSHSLSVSLVLYFLVSFCIKISHSPLFSHLAVALFESVLKRHKQTKLSKALFLFVRQEFCHSMELSTPVFYYDWFLSIPRYL